MPPREKGADPPTHSPVKDFYEVLSVSRKASFKEIGRAYRKIAGQYHPDLNPGDVAAAEEFRRVQEAYEVLSNPQKRKAYDYYGPYFGERIPIGDPAGQSASPHENDDATTVLHKRRDHTQGNERHTPWGGLPGPLSSPYRKLSSLTFAAVVVFGTILYFLLPNSGVGELKLAHEALLHVTSWKMQVRTPQADSTMNEFLDEVSCASSSERITQRTRATIDGRPTDILLETIVIGHDRYYYNDRDKAWSFDAAANYTLSFTSCSNLSDGRILPILEWLRGTYFIEKGQVRDTADGKCREWKVVSPGGFSRPPQEEFVCLGVTDHLPRRRGSPGGSGGVRFYDWNVPIDIRPPMMPSSHRLDGEIRSRQTSADISSISQRTRLKFH